jgi:hypothetical protein
LESTPQVAPRLTKAPEGTPGHFYRLRLADFDLPPFFVDHRNRGGSQMESVALEHVVFAGFGVSVPYPPEPGGVGRAFRAQQDDVVI